MARYSNSWTSATMTATADTAALVNATYAGTMLGAGATVQGKINEVYIGGESAASNPTTMILARDSTVAVGALSVGRQALTDVLSTAPGTLISWGNTAATSAPQRSATLHLLHLTLNTFGGIARWQARYGEEITMYGASANIGSLSLSAITGTGVSSGHILFEVL